MERKAEVPPIGRRGIILAALGLWLAMPGATLAADEAPVGTRVLTGKERLSGKAADEQRINDCKVPRTLRGQSRRPSGCKADVAGEAAGG